jgi:hypothetical protein
MRCGSHKYGSRCSIGLHAGPIPPLAEVYNAAMPAHFYAKSVVTPMVLIMRCW